VRDGPCGHSLRARRLGPSGSAASANAQGRISAGHVGGPCILCLPVFALFYLSLLPIPYTSCSFYLSLLPLPSVSARHPSSLSGSPTRTQLVSISRQAADALACSPTTAASAWLQQQRLFSTVACLSHLPECE